MPALNNRHLYAMGRATGPSRLIRLNVQIQSDSFANPPNGPVPIILGNSNAQQNLWRRITSTYEVVYGTKFVDSSTNNSATVSTYSGYNKSSNPLAVPADFIIKWAINGMSYEEFLDYLTANKLLLTELTIRQLPGGALQDNGSITAGGIAANNENWGIVNIGEYNCDFNQFELDKISILDYYDPNYGKFTIGNKPTDKVYPKIVSIPCDFVLGPNSAIILDFDASKIPNFGNVVYEMGLNCQEFTT